MPFYYECWTCNTQLPFDPVMDTESQFERLCTECNEAGCPRCMPDDVCVECFEKAMGPEPTDDL